MVDKYMPDQYEELKVGTKEETAITGIKQGPASEFRTEAYWENIKDATPEEIEEAKNRAAIEVRTDNGARLVINLPESNTVSPASNLALFKKTYGKYPEKGQKVTTKVDENGFRRIVLEK